MTAFIALHTAVWAVVFAWCIWYAVEERDATKLASRLLISGLPLAWGAWLLMR